MKKILIINGHPDTESFNYALSEAYKNGTAQHDISLSEINIAELDFDPNLKYGHRKRTELESDLKIAIDKIQQADHIVWFFPMWWYGYPAIMKGFIDRTFLSGIMYKSVPEKSLPEQLLKGKTARIILTSDTPGWYNYLVMKRPAINQLKKGTLMFCGVNPVKVTHIRTIKNSSLAQREKWLKKVNLLGQKLQ